MRWLPKSLAGRLALLLVFALVAAQALSFALFARERVEAFRTATREDLFDRFVSVVRLIDDAPPELHSRLLAAASSSLFRVTLADEAAVPSTGRVPEGVSAGLASKLARPVADLRVAFGPGRGWARGEEHFRQSRRRPWLTVSLRQTDGRWLNASADRAPTPPLGGAFLLSLLLSAVVVSGVGALAVRRIAQPLRRLADAADRLGRGETVEPLPETGAEEMRRTNVAFNRMRGRLDRYVRDRTAMLAAVAHDLRTPITTLRLRAEFIEEEETRTKILETLSELQAMAEASLAFSRGDAADEPARPMDFRSLTASLVDDLAETGHPITFEPGPVSVLSCRPLAMRRALRNLMENALAYGTSARVRLEERPADVRLTIDDEGPGIAEPDLERVFEPFVRLEGSRSRETGGVGLGLAIARSIVRGHGGEIRLENRAPVGLRATVALPRPVAF